MENFKNEIWTCEKGQVSWSDMVIKNLADTNWLSNTKMYLNLSSFLTFGVSKPKIGPDNHFTDE